jgi:pyruvate/2-oxoglutarate dehydrogenase complex dihydrolipoamide acyltransferase (E2) component
MFGALESRPLRSADISFINQQYLSCCDSTVDPTMVWGSEIEAENLLEFVKRCNRTAETLVSPAHLLVKAVADCMERFPELNARVIGGRIYRFRDISVRIIHYGVASSEVNIVTLFKANQLSLEEVSQTLWQSQLQIVQGGHDRFDKRILEFGPQWFRNMISRTYWWLDRKVRLPRINRIDRHLDSAVMVNYLGHAGLPSMKAYKPSKFPDESSLLNVTMGRIEPMAVVRNGQVVVRRMAPLFVRGDHRVTDAHQLGRFIAALRDKLEDTQALNLLHNPAQVAPPKAA